MAMADSLAALKSSIYGVQLSLLDGVSNNEQLQAAGKVLTQSEYADVVTERTIVNFCGYPLCRNTLHETTRKGRYRISLREHKVYDLQETRLYCSLDCLALSKTFTTSLPVDRDHSHKTLELAATFQNLTHQDFVHQHPTSDVNEGKTAQTQQLEQPRTFGEKTDSQMEQSQQQLNSSHFLLIREQSQTGIEDFSLPGPSNAIEGYVPQKEFSSIRHKKPSSGRGEDGTDRIISSKHLSKERSSKKKQNITSKKKPLPLGKSEPVSVLENEFTSCILVDAGELTNINESENTRELTESLHLAENLSGTLVKVNGKALIPATGKLHSKKHHRVSWADQSNMKLVEEASSLTNSSSHETPEDMGVVSEISSQDNMLIDYPSHNETFVSKEAMQLEPDQRGSEEQHVSRLDVKLHNDSVECAKALVTALTEAAEAVAQGEAESDEAVARAGISIVSKHDQLSSEATKVLKISEASSLDDFENVDPRSCWYSAPPKDFKPELSSFGMVWMALDEWISAASIAHVYGRESSEEENFSNINGKEYLRQVIMGNGVSAEIERVLAGCISRALPGLVEALRFPIPLSTLEQALGRLVRTMSLVTSIPPFSSKQWQVVVMLLLDALSVHRLPALRGRFSNARNQMQKVLNACNLTEAEYEVFRDLVLPMGMLPEFASHCGG